jgi:hypothetical protein
MASTKASVHTRAFGSTIEEENVILQVLLQILQQLLPACAQPLLRSSAQAKQGVMRTKMSFLQLDANLAL